MRAVADDARAAALLGVPTERVVLAAFALAGALAGLAGLLIAPQAPIGLEDGVLLGLKGMAAALLFRLGSLPLAIAGGLALGAAEGLILAWPGLGARWADIAILAAARAALRGAAAMTDAAHDLYLLVAVLGLLPRGRARRAAGAGAERVRGRRRRRRAAAGAGRAADRRRGAARDRARRRRGRAHRRCSSPAPSPRSSRCRRGRWPGWPRSASPRTGSRGPPSTASRRRSARRFELTPRVHVVAAAVLAALAYAAVRAAARERGRQRRGGDPRGPRARARAARPVRRPQGALLALAGRDGRGGGSGDRGAARRRRARRRLPAARAAAARRGARRDAPAAARAASRSSRSSARRTWSRRSCCWPRCSRGARSACGPTASSRRRRRRWSPRAGGLEVRDLHVTLGGREILRGLDLDARRR